MKERKKERKKERLFLCVVVFCRKNFLSFFLSFFISFFLSLRSTVSFFVLECPSPQGVPSVRSWMPQTPILTLTIQVMTHALLQLNFLCLVSQVGFYFCDKHHDQQHFREMLTVSTLSLGASGQELKAGTEAEERSSLVCSSRLVQLFKQPRSTCPVLGPPT